MLALAASMLVTPSASSSAAPAEVQTIVYANDFDASVGSEWSANAGILATPSGEKVLGSETSGSPGPIGSETLALTLTGLPAHSRMGLAVELYTLRSWDGNLTDFGPDLWDLDATGTAVDIQPLATFSNYVDVDQSYPDAHPGSNPGTTGAAATGDLLGLGTSGNQEIPAVRYELSYAFAHTASSVTFTFVGSNLQGWEDEGWVLDNVVVTVIEPSVTEVLVGDDLFEPDDVSVGVGDIVAWTNPPGGNPHNVRQDERLFRSGDPSPEFTFSPVFSAGTFHYYDEAYGSPAGGMDGFVRVPVKIAASLDGLPFTVRWATKLSDTGSAFDVQFRIDDGPWLAWEKDATDLKGVFGRKGSPVEIEAGATYYFRARSQVSTDTPRMVSGWSPPLAPQPPILQEGNDLPRARIPTTSYSELTGIGIGDMAELGRHSPQCPHAKGEFQRVKSLGVTWIRLFLDPGEWFRVEGPKDFSRFEINTCQDKTISKLAEKDVTIVLTIVYWDPELNAERPPDYGNREEVQRYLDYARHLVRHFKDRIRYYEILNEAVVYVDLPDYLHLVRRAVAVIREEYPEARIVAGGAANLLYPDSRDYLFGLLRSDVVPSIDAIGLHPMFGASPAFNDTREYYQEYPSLVLEIKDVAEAHGFAGEYIAGEMLWRTNKNPLPDQPWEYTRIAASKYLLRAIAMHEGMDVWAGIDGAGLGSLIPSIEQVLRDLSTVLDGVEPEGLAVQIDSQAPDIMSYGFSLPNGDRMLALWTNGTAVDDDPGVAATLTFADLAAEGAIGIDILNGFQQELITQQEAGGLVVHDLLVKDYPIFVRLIASSS